MAAPRDSATMTLSNGDGSTRAHTLPRRAPDWLTICWDVGCGWDHKAHGEEAARALKAEHVQAHPGHRVIVVRV